MPGNTTIYKEHRTFIPAIWKKVGVTSGQATGIAMEIAGITKSTLPLPREASIVSVGIVLTAAFTAGFMRLEISKNGTGTGKTLDMDPAKDVQHIWEFEPGELIGSKGDELGILWGSNGALAPSGSIEAAVFVEVQWA